MPKDEHRTLWSSDVRRTYTWRGDSFRPGKGSQIRECDCQSEFMCSTGQCPDIRSVEIGATGWSEQRDTAQGLLGSTLHSRKPLHLKE